MDLVAYLFPSLAFYYLLSPFSVELSALLLSWRYFNTSCNPLPVKRRDELIRDVVRKGGYIEYQDANL